MQAQSQTLAYIDTYMVLAVAAGIMFLLDSYVRDLKQEYCNISSSGQ